MRDNERMEYNVRKSYEQISEEIKIETQAVGTNGDSSFCDMKCILDR